MFAELVIVKLGPDMRSMAQTMADHLAPVYKTLKGFKSVVFIGDVDAGEYGSLSLWESREDAEALSGAVKGRLKKVASSVPKQGPTSRRIFEVYEPRL